LGDEVLKNLLLVVRGRRDDGPLDHYAPGRNSRGHAGPGIPLGGQTGRVVHGRYGRRPPGRLRRAYPGPDQEAVEVFLLVGGAIMIARPTLATFSKGLSSCAQENGRLRRTTPGLGVE